MTTMQLKFATGSFQLAAQTKNIAKLLAIGSIATGAVALMSVTPTQAAVIGGGQLAFSDGTSDFFGSVNPVAGNSFSVNFDPAPGFARVSSATEDFAPFFTLPPSQNYFVAAATGNFSYDTAEGAYRLLNNLPFTFSNGISIGVNAGSLFDATFNTSIGVQLSARNALGTITNPDGTVPAQQLAFSFNDLPNGGGGNYGILVSPTAVPEPFTIIGTLVGGAAVFRMRKRLKVDNKL